VTRALCVVWCMGISAVRNACLCGWVGMCIVPQMHMRVRVEGCLCECLRLLWHLHVFAFVFVGCEGACICVCFWEYVCICVLERGGLGEACILLILPSNTLVIACRMPQLWGEQERDGLAWRG